MIRLFRDEVGVLHACGGVDIQAARLAPVDEDRGIYISLDGDDAAILIRLLDSFRSYEPVGIVNV